MKQYDLFSENEIIPIENMVFDYGKGDFKKVDVIQKIKPVVYKPELKVIKHNKLFDYLISCIDESNYDLDLKNDYEKVKFLNDTFQSEWWLSHKNYYNNNEVKGFSEWIAGLPSSFNVAYENHVILEISVEFQLIEIKITEEQEEEFINNWWNLIAENFIKLREEMKKEAPLSNLASETLKNSKVEGMVVKLPEGYLDRKIYTEVKTKLELIGGKWKGNKVMGFVFNEDPTALLEEIANGGNRNLKKEFQFFATPDHLCEQLVELAELTNYHTILEPSAGQGAIIKAIHKIVPNVVVDCFEAMNVNKLFLDKLPNINFLGEDFLKYSGKKFNRIIANPPFSKNQDIDHVMKMWDCLTECGRIVTITSKHWQMSSNKKEVAFKDFLDKTRAKIIEVDGGEFKESGTNVSTVILVIDKTI